MNHDLCLILSNLMKASLKPFHKMETRIMVMNNIIFYAFIYFFKTL